MWLLLAASLAGPLALPPPPPPSPPGTGCSGEQLFTQNTGSVSVSFGLVDGRGALACSFVIHTAAVGVTLTITSLTLTGPDPTECRPESAYLRVYDGTSKLDNMLASYTCTESWSVASTGGSMMILFQEDGQHEGDFEFSWAPTDGSCGNGICESSADEYDTCLADCVTNRPGELPALSLQHHDTK